MVKDSALNKPVGPYLVEPVLACGLKWPRSEVIIFQLSEYSSLSQMSFEAAERIATRSQYRVLGSAWLLSATCTGLQGPSGADVLHIAWRNQLDPGIGSLITGLGG